MAHTDLRQKDLEILFENVSEVLNSLFPQFLKETNVLDFTPPL